ncbi:Uncharacterised protein [Serratia quinivorans]|nr:Uncharacterised protein [Serratia quinivorans]
MFFHQPVARLIALYQQHQAQIGHIAEEGLHRPVAAEQDQHPFVLARGLLGAEKARHLFQMFGFIGHRRLKAHIRNNNFALFHMIEGGRQGFKAIAGFFT